MLANDTPTLTVSGLTDGMLLEPGETPIDLVLTVTDHDVSSGSLTGSVSSASGAATLTLGSLDASGVASATLVLPERDVYTASFTFTDAYGVAVTTDPIVVTTDQAPTVGLLTPSSGETVTIPSDNPSFEAYTYSLEVADADGDALTVQPAVGFDDRVACSDSTGRWDCDLDTTGWTAGVYTVAVLVSDGLLEATDSFDIEVVGADDYDYDGVVNDGLPDPEGGNTIGEATSITGTTVTLSSGDSIEDYGSLSSETDIDWWYFRVAVDRGSVANASFSVHVVVPGVAEGTPDGDWQTVVWTQNSASGAMSQVAPTAISSSCDLTSMTCTLAFEVRSDPDLNDQLDWWIGVTADAWSPSMCVDSPSDWSYALTVSS